MSKNSVSEWSTVSSGNGDIAGLTLGLDMPPSYVNNAMQEMMAQIKQWKDGYTDPITGLPVYQSLTVENINIVGVNDIQGEFQINGSTGTLGQVVVSQGASSSPVWGSGFPVGGIILWSGSKTSVPSGWHMCDGTSGTPNLKGRFVVGAGTTYDVNETGGSANATLVAHKHTGNTDFNGEHYHSGVPQYGSNWFSVQSGGGTWAGAKDGGQGGFTDREGEHSHSFETYEVGDSAINANIPPYYALCYIMKL